MSNIQTPGLTLRDDDFPLLTPTIINQIGIEKNSTVMPFGRLVLLNTALDALQPYPPNNHTVLFEDTIQVQNVGATQNLEINNNQINILGTGVNPTAVTIQGDFTPPNVSNFVITDNTQYFNAMTKNQIVVGDMVNNTSINIDGTTTSITLTDGTIGANCQIQASGGDFVINPDTNRLLMGNTQESYWGDYSVGTHSEINQNVGGVCQIKLNSRFGTLTAGDADESNGKTTLYIEDSSKTIRLNAYDTTGGTGGNTQLNSVDILSNVGAVGSPPSFTLPINFTLKWERNYAYTNVGNWEMVRDTSMTLPIEYFTLSAGYTVWKVDVAFNCWNMTVQDDKEYAMYLEFIDSSSNSYSGFCFNLNTPFTTHKTTSTYNATQTQIENYCWSDHIDFTSSTGGAFTVNLWRYGVNTMSCDFRAIITLSKTNLI